MLLTLVLLLAAADPMRTTTAAIPSVQTMAELQSCTAQILAAHGRVTPIVTPENVTLLFNMPGLGLAGPGEAKLAIRIEDKGDTRLISVSYRHPLSAKGAANFLRDTAKKCFADDFNAANQEQRGGAKVIN